MTKLYASCHCGIVKIDLFHKPDFINNCNCSLCSKAGALWGYFKTKDVQLTGKTKPYLRMDKANAVVEIHACEICASTTHSLFTSAFQESSGISDRIGVNMRLFDRNELIGVEMRFPDGKNWPGEGGFEYRRDPRILK